MRIEAVHKIIFRLGARSSELRTERSGSFMAVSGRFEVHTVDV